MQTDQQTQKQFDYRTHIKDPKSGEIIKFNHYVMEASKDKGVRFERPIGSGNYYDGAGKLLIKGKDPVVEKTAAEVRQELETATKALAEENAKLKAQIDAMTPKQENKTHGEVKSLKEGPANK